MLLATSSCLVGNKVRYDGTDKHNHTLFKELADLCHFEAVCPEHLAFGTPRPTIDIVLDKDDLTVVTSRTAENVTVQLQAAINTEIRRLKKLPLAGMILKARSPSCGINNARYYEQGEVIAVGDGLFAKACSEAFPGLPMIDEEQLDNDELLQDFINRITAYHSRYV